MQAQVSEETDITAKQPQAEPKRHGRFRRRFLAGIVLGVLVFALVSFYAELRPLAAELVRFSYPWFVPVVALALTNYLLRFLKWEYFLSRLGISVPKRTSLGIFLSGLMMSVTPGKVGELLKSYLLREANGTPMATSAPIVIAERVTDLVAVILLSLLGLWVFTEQLWITVAAGGAVAFGIAVVAVRSAGSRVCALLGKLPLLCRFSGKLLEMYDSMHTLLKPVPLLLMTALSLAAWACECFGLYLVLHGFGLAEFGIVQAFFIYAFSTLVGIVSPGGLGLTDFSLIGLTMQVSSGFAVPAVKATAGAASILIRLATLWFAVAVGAVAFFILNRSLHVDLDEVGDEAGSDET